MIPREFNCSKTSQTLLLELSSWFSRQDIVLGLKEDGGGAQVNIDAQNYPKITH